MVSPNTSSDPPETNMTASEKVARRKLSLLDLARDLDNVSKACKLMGGPLQGGGSPHRPTDRFRKDRVQDSRVAARRWPESLSLSWFSGAVAGRILASVKFLWRALQICCPGTFWLNLARNDSLISSLSRRLDCRPEPS